MKTGDPQGPWVRIPPSPPFTTESPFTNFALEKYSRGRRGAPAKGVGRETGARVQIPPSPPRRRKRYIACGDSFCKNRRALILLRLLFPTKLCFANFCGGPGWAPHESAGLFTLFSGFGSERREARAKSSSAACGGYSENFLALRSARPRRLRPPMAAPGTARGAALSVPAALPWKHLKQSSLLSPPPRQVQQESFGAAVGKAEAAAPADGRAGHRKRGRVFRPGRTSPQVRNTFSPRPSSAALQLPPGWSKMGAKRFFHLLERNVRT